MSRDPVPQLTLYREWLGRDRGLYFKGYQVLFDWSTRDVAAFWSSIWDYFDLQSPTRFDAILRGAMPDAEWFAGAQVNYARQVFRHAEAADAAGQPAIIAQGEHGAAETLTWKELHRRVASLAIELLDQGVGRGDRVAAYLPNTPAAVISMLACASIGAIWTICAPDMGTPAVLDRFRQAAPKALIAADGVFYGGKAMDRSTVVADIRRGLPSIETVIVARTKHATSLVPNALDFSDAIARNDDRVAAFEPCWVPFEHPLWILYSSGTTGLPKAIVHSHGGVILTGCTGNMHLDLGSSYSQNNFAERFHWYSSTGWVMWNVQVGGLLTGTTICLFDGSPRGAAEDGWRTLWSYAARHKVTWFGAGAAFYSACRKADLELADIGDLGAMRALGSTGSPLDAETQHWGTRAFAAIGKPEIWWCNISGGTDIAAAFLSGNRELPATPGRMQCRHLGAAVEAWNENGVPVIGQVGELVCTKPFPSMPLRFWADEDGSRYRDTYFGKWPGIWRHGDWLTIAPDGSCMISGRSDATINRHGLRMGSADIYTAVEALDSVESCMVIDLEDGRGESELVMFVVPASGRALDDAMIADIASAIRTTLSPRFVPDRFLPAPAIPLTLSGKKQEVPIKRLFLGWPVEAVIDPNLTQNPEVLDWYILRANERLQTEGGPRPPATEMHRLS